jgi:5-methylcytosine-specific restriction endonuclease McrA
MARYVHHIKPKREYPDLALDIENLMSLCRMCHDDLTNEEKAKRIQDQPYQFSRGKTAARVRLKKR